MFHFTQHPFHCRCLSCTQKAVPNVFDAVFGAVFGVQPPKPRPPGSVAGVFDAPYGVQPSKPWPRDPACTPPMPEVPKAKDDIYAATANRILSDRIEALKSENAGINRLAEQRFQTIAEQNAEMKKRRKENEQLREQVRQLPTAMDSRVTELTEQVRLLKFDLASVTATAGARLGIINDMTAEMKVLNKRLSDPSHLFLDFIRHNRTLINQALR